MAPATRTLQVDGHTWEWTDAGNGRHHFAWLTGKDPGYGFTSQTSDPSDDLSEAMVVEHIRDFMGDVNPETGHLD